VSWPFWSLPLSQEVPVASAAGKPTLKEIASMPYPTSERAMREHYDPQWGKAKPEGKLRSYSVEVSYSFRGRDTWTTRVNAHDADEARELAGDEFDKADLDLPWDADVDDADFEVTEAGDPRPASVDTHAKRGDATQIVAPFMSGAVPKGDAQ
jgi:hypothetical protein